MEHGTGTLIGMAQAAISKGAGRTRKATAATAGPCKPPPFQPVQLAALVDHVPAGDRWLHELKFDGYRCLISVAGDQAHAFTRSGLDWSDRFAAVIDAAKTLNARSALIDGEAVIIDADGKSNFQALQAAIKGNPEAIQFYAFDLLELDGEDLTGLPLIERKAKLAALLEGNDGVIHYSDHIVGKGEQLFDSFCGAGLEGVISKRVDARYVGSRNGAWLKTKCIRRQEFVVVGLLTCVQMGTIEFHGWGSRIEDVEKADRLAFDLDPDEGLDFEAVRKAAFHFRDILKSIGLETFPMVTGGKGVHVIAPLTPQAEWPEVKDFAHRLALAVAQADPENFTAALPKIQRKGRIFVDYLRNQRGATAVMPYGARARAGAPVAVPITWKEMETIDKPSHWHVGDGAELVKRARSKALSGWGRADQVLPDL